MSEQNDLINNAKVEKNDFIFDFKELYTHATDWLVWKQFTVIESKYTEKVGAKGKSYEIHWYVKKRIDNYSEYVMEIVWNLSDINDVEATVDKKRLKLQKGDITFDLTAYITTDKEDKWENSPILKLFKGFFERYIYRTNYKRMEDELWRLSWEFHAEVKSFLELYRYA
jgi:hypothetical protein|tara:strand:- start:643 stop:1149 length:507 start_codon:yes stop_codon:yes gene_type:complete